MQSLLKNNHNYDINNLKSIVIFNPIDKINKQINASNNFTDKSFSTTITTQGNFISYENTKDIKLDCYNTKILNDKPNTLLVIAKIFIGSSILSLLSVLIGAAVIYLLTLL